MVPQVKYGNRYPLITPSEVKIKRLERALAKVRKSRDYHQQQARFWKQAYDGAQEQLRAERHLRLNRWRGGTWSK